MSGNKCGIHDKMLNLKECVDDDNGWIAGLTYKRIVSRNAKTKQEKNFTWIYLHLNRRINYVYETFGTATEHFWNYFLQQEGFNKKDSTDLK